MRNLKNKDSNLNTYNIIRHNEFSFSFTTDNACEYECYFLPYEGYFQDFPEIASKVFGFNLELKFKPDKNIGIDSHIAATVATIIKDFLSQRIHAVVYVCDNNDNNEKIRFQKFNNWFDAYDDGSTIRLTSIIKLESQQIFNAMFIHIENKQANKFIAAYQILTGAYSKEEDDINPNILNEPEW